MKKILIPMLAALLMGPAFTSCSKEEVLESTVIRTKEVTLKWNDWEKLSNDANFVYHDVEWEVLTDLTIYDGMVNVYVYDNGLQNPLPYVYPTEVVYDDGTTGIVGENLRFDMQRGVLTLIMQDLDGYAPMIDNTTPTMTFRIVAAIPQAYIIEQ